MSVNQTWTVILWRKPEEQDKPFEIIAQEAYDTLNVLQEYPQDIRPNYLSATKKSLTRQIEWEKNVFFELLRKNVSKRGKEEFAELGYTVQFFSSLRDDESCGILLSAGIKDYRFVNSFCLELPYNMDVSEHDNSKMISELFCDLVSQFHPFWGVVTNNKLKVGDSGYYIQNKPTYLSWMNYFSEETLANIGKNKIQEIINKCPEAYFKNGTLCLRENALNAAVDEDKKLFEYVNKIYLS